MQPLKPFLMALVLLTAAHPVLADSPPQSETTEDASQTESQSTSQSKNDAARGEIVRGEITVTSTLPEMATSLQIPGSDLAGSQDAVRHLRDVAGLDAIRRGTVNLEPVVRGLQESQVALFVDGTRTFAAGPGRMDSDLSHVGPHAIQNVEVVKGPYALSWGSGTLSAIRLLTIRPDFAAPGSAASWGGNVGASWGENGDTSDVHSSVSGGGERFRFALTAGRRTGDDYEDGDGVVVPGDYESNEIRWRLGFRPTSSLAIDYSGGFQEQDELDYPGRILDATYFDTRSHALDLEWFGGGRVEDLAAQVYGNRKDHRMNNDEKPSARDMPGRIPPFGLRVDLPTESNTAGGRFRLGLASRGNTETSFGVDAYRVEQNARRTISRRSNDFVIFRDIIWPDAEIKNVGGWVQVVSRRGDVSWGAALRADQVDASAGEVSDFFATNTVGDTDQSESNLSAAVNGVFDRGEHWTVEVGLGRAVRTANATERYSDRFPSTKFQVGAEFMGNPLLDPEKSLELDVDARARYGDFYLQLSGFVRQIDDYITVSPDPTLTKRLPLSPPVVYRYVNGDRATYRGAEVLLRNRASDVFAWRASLSWVRAQDEELDEPVLGISPLHGELGVRLTPGLAWWIDASLRWFDRQDRVATSRFEQSTRGYELFDLAAGYRWDSGLSLTLGVDNVTDESYASHLNSPNPFTGDRIAEPGRAIRLAVDWDF